MLDAGGRLARLFEGRGVDDRLRIEDRQVGEIADRQRAALRDAEFTRGQAGHPEHGLFQAEQADIPGIVAEHARKRAPQARMRVDVVRQAVRADHGARMRDDIADIGLVELEVDRACRQQALPRLALAAVPFPRNVGNLAPRHFGMRVGPGDEDLQPGVAALQPEHSRARGIGIDIHADVHRLARLVDALQRRPLLPKLARPVHWWCEMNSLPPAWSAMSMASSIASSIVSK